MKVFLTGAAGFIGNHLLNLIIQRSKYSNIVCPVRDMDKIKRKFSNEKVFFYEGDISVKEDIEGKINGCDIVFHLAAKSLTKDRNELLKVNVDGTKNIIEEALKSQCVKRIIYLSSIWAVDRSLKDDFSLPLSSKSVPNPRTFYGKTKLEAEKIIEKSGIPYTILRLPPVYGPESNLNYFLLKLIRGIEKGSSIYHFPFPGSVSLAYVESVADACLIAAESKELENKTIFFCTEERLKILDISSEIMHIMGKKRKKGEFLKKIASVFEKIFTSYIGRVIIPVKIQTLFSDYLVCDSVEFEKTTGYKSKISFREGLIETIDWYKKQKFN
ncbi:MAG: NAD(P)-dependent oxidoreductase [Candidatus Schekmanbacteria bacterium]|nr:MAG: NAD(P)-dependent oxidoreductase [Candidatus Schekmanbacteria bacterium]